MTTLYKIYEFYINYLEFYLILIYRILSKLYDQIYYLRVTKTVENKSSYKIINRRLYQKSRIGELPHFCNVCEKVQSIGDVCDTQTRRVFQRYHLYRWKYTFVKTIHPCIVLTAMVWLCHTIATAWNNRHPWR